MNIDLFKPIIQIKKALFLKQIKNQHNAIRIFIVSASDSPIPLLSGGIPNLQLNFPIIMSQWPKPKVYSNRGDIVLIELIVSEPDQETGFSHTTVS